MSNISLVPSLNIEDKFKDLEYIIDGTYKDLNARIEELEGRTEELERLSDYCVLSLDNLLYLLSLTQKDIILISKSTKIHEMIEEKYNLVPWYKKIFKKQRLKLKKDIEKEVTVYYNEYYQNRLVQLDKVIANIEQRRKENTNDGNVH